MHSSVSVLCVAVNKTIYRKLSVRNSIGPAIIEDTFSYSVEFANIFFAHIDIFDLNDEIITILVI